MYAYIHMYIDWYVCIHIYVSVYIMYDIYVYAHKDESIVVTKLYNAHVGACMYVCMVIYLYLSVYDMLVNVWNSVCVYVYMLVHVCIYLNVILFGNM